MKFEQNSTANSTSDATGYSKTDILMTEAKNTNPHKAKRDSKGRFMSSNSKPPKFSKEAADLVKKAESLSRMKAKTKKTAIEKIKKIFSILISAMKLFVKEVYSSVVVRGAKAVRNFFRRLSSMILSWIKLGYGGNIDEVIHECKLVAKSAGRQALAAALITLLSALSEGAKNAISEYAKSAESGSALKAIFSDVASSASSIASDISRSSELSSSYSNQFGFNEKNYSAYSRGHDNVPPWARV